MFIWYAWGKIVSFSNTKSHRSVRKCSTCSCVKYEAIWIRKCRSNCFTTTMRCHGWGGHHILAAFFDLQQQTNNIKASPPPPPVSPRFWFCLRNQFPPLFVTRFNESKFRKGKDDNCVPDIEERIKPEEKAKAVASAFGGRIYSIHCRTLAVLHWTIWIIGWIAPGWFERKGWIHPILQNRPSQNN